MKISARSAAVGALLTVQVFFGTLPVIGKIVMTTIPPVALVGFRVGITAVILLAIQAVRGRVWLKFRSDYWRLAVLSLFGVTFNQLLFIKGLSLTKASNTSLLAVTIPVFALAAGSIAGFEKLRPVKIVGIIVAAVGVILLIDPTNASYTAETTLGDILIVLNSLSYGIYVATSKSVIVRNGAFRSIMWVFLFASVICVPLGAYYFVPLDASAIEPVIWLLILHIAVMATAVPYFLNAWALVRVNPSTVAIFIYLQPVIGFVAAVLYIRESIGPKFFLATALIFVGVYLVTAGRGRRAAEAAETEELAET